MQLIDFISHDFRKMCGIRLFLQPQRKVEGRAAFGASLSNAMLGVTA